jgi:PAS domain S-box-containing protein
LWVDQQSVVQPTWSRKALLVASVALLIVLGGMALHAVRALVAARLTDGVGLTDAVQSAERTALLAGLAVMVSGIALVLLVYRVRRRSEARLARSRQWLLTTLQSIGDAVIATDEAGKVVFMNGVASRLTGWPLSEAYLQPLNTVFQIVAQETGSTMETPVSQVLREGRDVALAGHTILIRRDGERIPIEDSGAPISDEARHVLGVVLVFKDASERQRAERALADTEERLRLALESAELGTWDLDLTAGNLPIWSPHLYRIFGLDPEVTLTRDLRRSVIVEEDRGLLDQALLKAQEERSFFALELRLRRPSDGALRWIGLRGSYRYDESGRAVRLLGVAQDVTDRRQLEQR